MKGIILAGGTGSRLYPLTKVINKHLLPVGKYPMIYHTLKKLREASIREILLVTSSEHIGSIAGLLGSGCDFGIKLTYKIQDHAGGIAQALALAEDFVQEQPMLAILGDNVFSDNLSPYVNNYQKVGRGAMVLLKEVADPRRYGIATIKDNKITMIEEKPRNPRSHYAVTGVYMYDSQVFEIIKTLTVSTRGELEITDVNKAYLLNNQLYHDFLKGWWIDAGTPASLLQANVLAKEIDLQ